MFVGGVGTGFLIPSCGLVGRQQHEHLGGFLFVSWWNRYGVYANIVCCGSVGTSVPERCSAEGGGMLHQNVDVHHGNTTVSTSRRPLSV